MLSFRVVDDIGEIHLSSDWFDSAKFNSKGKSVGEEGKPVTESFDGKRYSLVAKKERNFTTRERIGRGLLAVIAAVSTLGIALLFQSVRKLLTQKSRKIRFAVPVAPSENRSSSDKSAGWDALRAAMQSDSEDEEDDSFPTDEVRKSCQQWMTQFLREFKPLEVKQYTLRQLYSEDVSASVEETDAIRGVYRTLWNKSGRFWEGKLPPGWTKHSGSVRSYHVEHPDFPDFIFKCCSGTPGVGNPAAHFLRVPKGKEIQKIADEELFDELEIVDEELIALKSEDEIKKAPENKQCFHFAVKSRKIDLLSSYETVSRLASHPQEKQIKIAAQIMKMICRSGLGDVGFHNFMINKATGKLVVLDTEPLYNSLLLNEKSKFDNQYYYTHMLMKGCNNSKNVTKGLNAMISTCETLPAFKKVAQIYKEAFPYVND